MNTQDWRRLNELADRLEKAWEKADDVDLAQFLPSTDDTLRADVLRELITTDLEIRWRRKQGRPLEFYVALYPELGSVSALSPKLIYEEYRVRCRHGDHPELETYKERFPEQYPQVQKMLQQDPVVTLRTIHSTPPYVSPTPSPSGKRKALDETHLLVVGGGYSIEKLIGRGGFGEVWRATAPGGFPAAIKIITRPADHEERIREERALEVIKQLNHHFLIKTTASWSEEDKLYIVMDLADGSLRERLKQCKAENQGGIPVAELLRYFREAAEALDYLHEQDVLHRDIKPDNILLIGHHVRLADFGLARHQEQILASVSGAGTPAYMAPEVWRGKASKHSDQYSLAYTYAELRLGHRAFTSTDYAGVMFDHLDHTPNLEPIPEAEKVVLLQALAKKPDERYPSCLNFIEALEDAIGIVPRGSRPVATIGRGGLNQNAPKRQKEAQKTLSGADLTAHRPKDVDPMNTNLDTLNSRLPNQHDRMMSVTGGLPAGLKVAPRKRKRSVFPVVLVGLLFAAIIAGFAGLIVWAMRPQVVQPKPEAASFTLTVPSSVTLRPGEPQKVTFRVKRQNMNRAIELNFETTLPVQPKSATIPADADTIDVDLVANAGATSAKDVLQVHAVSADLERSEDVAVTIEALPPMTPVRVPEHYKPAPNAVRQPPDFRKQVYFDRLVADFPDVPPVTFVLIPQMRATEPPSYYLMETKVSNALALALAKKSGLTAPWLDDANKANKSDEPAFGMKAAEANALARVLDGLLPTTQQWDRAAGLDATNRPSPNVGGPDPAINRWKEGPRSVTNVGDRSVFGIYDMAGNGMEFTRNLIIDGKIVPWQDNPKDALVILRGKRYRASKPLLFSELSEQQTTPLTQFYDAGSPYTTFRVVLVPH